MRWEQRMNTRVEHALSERIDLDQFPSVKRTLFGLQVRFALEDIASVAATSVTDGPDDKSCDLVYVDRESRRVIVAQEYTSTANARTEPKQTKVASLRQAVSYIFDPNSQSTPARLVSAAREVADAMKSGMVDDIEVWFVHNLHTSPNVDSELRQVEHDAQALAGC